MVQQNCTERKDCRSAQTKPEIMEPPIKCYIYCKKERSKMGWLRIVPGKGWQRLDGTVIGEFICDEIYKIDMDSVGFNFTAPSLDLPVYTIPENNDEECNDKLKKLTTCLTDAAISKYLGIHPGYGWHISDLKIYDQPRKLEEFTGLQSTRFGIRPVEVHRAPQSWRYVEELK